jgi:heme exporter protein D
MINNNRSWVWLAIILTVYAVWKFIIKPRMDRKNKE